MYLGVCSISFVDKVYAVRALGCIQNNHADRDGTAAHFDLGQHVKGVT